MCALQYIAGSKGKGSVSCNSPAPSRGTVRRCKPGPFHLFVSSAMATAEGFQRDMQLTSKDGCIFFFATVGGVESAGIHAISYRSFVIIPVGSTSPSLYIVFAKFVKSY
jgi:hypothetical protein